MASIEFSWYRSLAWLPCRGLKPEPERFECRAVFPKLAEDWL